jgi:hypothetical protein
MSTLTDPLDPDCAPAASDPAVFGGVEAGGTKWVCAKGTGPGHTGWPSRFAEGAVVGGQLVRVGRIGGGFVVVFQHSASCVRRSS